MYRILILPDARRDILKASEWYENQSESLGGVTELKKLLTQHR